MNHFFQFLITERFGEILLKNLDFLFVLSDKVRTIGILDFLDGVFALLDFFHQDGHDGIIRKFGLFINLFVPDSSPDHTQDGKAFLTAFPFFHGGLHIRLQEFS